MMKVVTVVAVVTVAVVVEVIEVELMVIVVGIKVVCKIIPIMMILTWFANCEMALTSIDPAIKALLFQGI